MPAAAAAELSAAATEDGAPGGKIVTLNAARDKRRYLERMWSKLNEEQRRGLQQRIAAWWRAGG